MTEFLAATQDFNATVKYSELFASFAGEFVDLRGVNPPPTCLHPDKNIGYPAGNALADEAQRIAQIVSEQLSRPMQNTHVFYLPPGIGRIAFGGNLVRA